MFVDEAKIILKAGKGGDGAISFLKEKYIAKGGPNGGNGGKGGDIIFLGSRDENSLFSFKHLKTIEAEEGEKGGKKLQFGRTGKNSIIKVPLGTSVYEGENLIADITECKEYIICHGGKGGRGNATFKNSKNRVPKIAELGKLGEQKEVKLILKLIADIGFVGFPNVGKSSLLKSLTNAKPIIGNYPFSTIEPTLGILDFGDESIVLADLPGLIEGASEGKGLGFSFLKHIQRCKALVLILSLESEVSLFDQYNILKKELKTYSEFIENKNFVVFVSKTDTKEQYQKEVKILKSKIKEEVYSFSNFDFESLNKLKKILLKLSKLPVKETQKNKGLFREYNAYKANEKNSIQIEVIKPHQFKIVGERAKDIYFKYSLSTEEGVQLLINNLYKEGVEKMLKEKGAVNGDDVILEDFTFTFME